MSEYDAMLEQGLYIAGAQPGSQYYNYAKSMLSTPSKAKRAFASVGVPVTDSDSIRLGLAQVTQAIGREAPRSARVNPGSLIDRDRWDFGHDKVSYTALAYEDYVTGRWEKIKGSYADLKNIGKGEGSFAWDAAQKLGKIGMANADMFLNATPLVALSIGAYADSLKSMGVKDEAAKDFYENVIPWADVIAFGAEIATGAGVFTATTKGAGYRALKKAGKNLQSWLTRHALEDTAVATHAREAVQRSLIQRAVDTQRALMVTPPSTALRNFRNAMYRSGVDAATQAVAYGLDKTAIAVRKAMGVDVSGAYNMTWKQGTETARIYSRMMAPGGKKYWDLFDTVIDAHPTETKGLLTKYVGDLDMAATPSKTQQVVQVLNTINWKQEKFHRGLKFMSALDDRLRDYGFKHGIDDLVDATYHPKYKAMRLKSKSSLSIDDIPFDIVEGASQDALYHTFAAEPTGGWGKIYSVLNDTKYLSTALKATALPFPRYLVNAVEHMVDYNPLKTFKIFKTVLPRSQLTRTDVYDTAQGIIGLTTVALVKEAYDAGMVGDNWHEVNIGGKTIDIKQDVGPAALFFQVGALLGKIGNPNANLDWEKERWDMWNNLLLTPAAREVGLEQVSELMVSAGKVAKGTGVQFWDYVSKGQTTGNPELDEAIEGATTFLSTLASRFLVPLNPVKDLLTTISPDMAVKREFNKSPSTINIAPIMNQIPYLNRNVPPKFSDQRAGPVTAPHGLSDIALKFVGLNPVERNFIETELLRIGLGRKGTRPTGVYEYDLMMKERTGQYLEAYSNWLKNDPLIGIDIGKGDYVIRRYSKLADDPALARKTKEEFLRRLVIVATDYADRDVQFKLLNDKKLDTIAAVKFSRVNKNLVDIRKSKGYNTIEALGGISAPKIGSDKTIRRQVQGIPAEHEFTPYKPE